MRYKLTWQTAVLFRFIRIVIQTDSHDHCRSTHLSTVLQCQQELVSRTLNRGDIGFIDVRHGILLEPEPIVDESLYRQRITFFILLVLSKKAVKAVLLVGIREITGPPVRTQAHTRRHMLTP